MNTRDGYPPGVPCWIDLTQRDARAAGRFYAGIFGWEVENRMPPGAPVEYLVATLDGHDVAAIGSPREGAPPAGAWNTYVWVESTDEAAARVRDAGGTILVEPFDAGTAGRMATVADPSGAAFSLMQAAGHRGAQVVNASGTWNWSDLHTDDPQGAKRFYGEAFGWVAETVSMPDFEATMWWVPGYGDFLAEREPGLRERQSGVGAPPGFEDAIGWLQPVQDGEAPHWPVTFAADDTDAVAARAADLGGEVVSGPTDFTMVRHAMIRDPQGATFSVNTFTPPA
jgi:predicted enzyme related to lactoylglutathione lyase